MRELRVCMCLVTMLWRLTMRRASLRDMNLALVDLGGALRTSSLVVRLAVITCVKRSHCSFDSISSFCHNFMISRVSMRVLRHLQGPVVYGCLGFGMVFSMLTSVARMPWR